MFIKNCHEYPIKDRRIYFSQNFRIQIMRYSLPFILLMLIVQLAFSQISRQEYIQKYQLLAIEEMGRSGIPASIKMAQAVLESGNGNSELSLKSNNHFGIKCKRNWRGGKVYYDDDAKDECFRKYKSVKIRTSTTPTF